MRILRPYYPGGLLAEANKAKKKKKKEILPNFQKCIPTHVEKKNRVYHRKLSPLPQL